MLTVKLLSVAAFIGSIAWLIHTPDYEPVIAAITSLSGCIAAFLVDRSRKTKAVMHQSVGNGSVGIQAGSDICVGNINNEKGE
jgi:hypothetical protein